MFSGTVILTVTFPKTNSLPPKIGLNAPKGKDRIPAIHFQVRTVSFREGTHNDRNKQLVGGFNPFKKYKSKWESSPSRGENKTYLKPPPKKHLPQLSFCTTSLP